MLVQRFTKSTARRTHLLEITAEVRRIVVESRVRNGTCHIYVPHTTAGVTINENADPDVVRDLEMTFDRLVPRDPSYRHAEGNSDSHVKTSVVGTSQTVFVRGGDLWLGRWQGIFLCEFDGPRTREVLVRVAADPATA